MIPISLSPYWYVPGIQNNGTCHKDQIHPKINMTPETKCIQTIYVVIATIIIVVINKEMFFETKHVGNLLEEKILNREIN